MLHEGPQIGDVPENWFRHISFNRRERKGRKEIEMSDLFSVLSAFFAVN
jgi:hypothetical protein